MFNINKSSKSSRVLHSLSYWTLLVLAAVLPICVLTTSLVPAIMSKIFIGGSIVFIALIFFSIAHMKMQELSVPKSLLLVTSWLLPVAYLFSTLFASTGSSSLFGEQLTMDSTIFMLIVAVTLTVTAITLNTPKRALGVYLAMLVSATLLTVLELIIFFAREGVASMGIALQSVSLVGSLNDLAVFFGLIVLFVLLSLLLLPVTSFIRGILWTALAASIFFLAVVNLSILWWILGGFALACFVYSISLSYGSHDDMKSSLSISSLVVLVLAALFLFTTGSLTTSMAEWANVGQLDVRPSWETTVSIGGSALEDNSALFGTGPGTFSHVWSQYMPPAIATTAFWQAEFLYGIGLVPTAVVTTGLLGALAWLLFFMVFLWTGIRSFVLSRNAETSDITGYVRITSFVGALYLWIITIIQVPSPTLVIYAALLTGTFIASLRYGSDGAAYLHFVFRNNPRVGFITTLVLTLALLGGVGGVYGLSVRYAAEASYQDAVVAVTVDQDVDRAHELVEKAIQGSQVDVYYRLISNLDVLRIRELVAQGKAPEEIREEFEMLLARSVAHAAEAIKLDTRDYQNHLNLGNIYQSIVPLGVDRANESALAAYDDTLKLRPSAPSVYFSKALLERARANNEKAREYVNEAITLRNQYTEAIFLLAQMQLEDQDVPNAIKSVEAITILEPRNAVASFQLGLLHYGSNDFVAAAQAFERAVKVNEVYANARYFLGLSYWRLGSDIAALQQFKAVLETNKDNAQIKAIIANLEAGKDPFTAPNTSADIQDLSGVPVDRVNDGIPDEKPGVLAE